jgi:hypothetical protein
VVATVPRKESDPAARHLADKHSLARLTVRGVDLHLVGGGQELVEAGTSDDPDVRDRCHGRQATFSPDELAELPAEELADEDPAEVFSPPEADEEESFAADESFAEPVSAEDVEPAVPDFDDPFLLSVR